MSVSKTPGPSRGASAQALVHDGVLPSERQGPIEDAELIALTAPPKGSRTVTVALMGAVVAASLALVLSFRADLAYFFKRTDAVVLGEAINLDLARVESNSYASVSGTPMASATVRFERPLEGEPYLVFPLAGQRSVFVQVRGGTLEERSLARRDFTGRLVSFRDLGARMAVVREKFVALGIAASPDAVVLIADETPGTNGWVLALVGFALLIIAIDLALIVRWFRPLPVAD